MCHLFYLYSSLNVLARQLTLSCIVYVTVQLSDFTLKFRNDRSLIDRILNFRLQFPAAEAPWMLNGRKFNKGWLQFLIPNTWWALDVRSTWKQFLLLMETSSLQYWWIFFSMTIIINSICVFITINELLNHLL